MYKAFCAWKPERQILFSQVHDAGVRARGGDDAHVHDGACVRRSSHDRVCVHDGDDARAHDGVHARRSSRDRGDAHAHDGDDARVHDGAHARRNSHDRGDVCCDYVQYS